MYPRPAPLWIVILSTLSLLVGFLTGCESMEMSSIPPIHFSGSLGNTVRTTDTGTQPRFFANQAGGSVRANSYIWQPWFTTVESSLSLAQEIRSGGTTNEGDSILAGGELTFNVLPLSRYPGVDFRQPHRQ